MPSGNHFLSPPIKTLCFQLFSKWKKSKSKKKKPKTFLFFFLPLVSDWESFNSLHPCHKLIFSIFFFLLSFTLLFNLQRFHSQNMSWNAYIDTMLTATGHVDQACILSKADASVWASTPEFCVIFFFWLIF